MWKRLNVRVLKCQRKNWTNSKALVILYGVVKCVEKNEMCGFWKLNYKILDKNLTKVLLYREVKCVENDEICGFWS